MGAAGKATANAIVDRPDKRASGGNGAAPLGMRAAAADAAAVDALRQRVKAREVLSARPMDARSKLAHHLALRGFKIKDVPGDNNCQFHALADQLQQV